MSSITIDLEKHRTKGSKVFTGRDRGIEVRTDSNIDKYIIEEGKKVDITIPIDIMSINPSFLEEFLTNVVLHLGKEGFYHSVKFNSESKRYDISEDLEEAVDRILRKENALTKK